MDRPSDKLASLTPVIRIFGNVTNTVTATDIPKAYKRQIENFEAMQEQAKNLEAELNKRKQIASDYEVKLAEVKTTKIKLISKKYLDKISTKRTYC